MAPVPAGPRRGHQDATAHAPGRGRSALPAGRQRAALHRPALAAADRRVRPVPRRVPRLRVVGTTRSADRSDDPDARLVRPPPGALNKAPAPTNLLRGCRDGHDRSMTNATRATRLIAFLAAAVVAAVVPPASAAASQFPAGYQGFHTYAELTAD